MRKHADADRRFYHIESALKYHEVFNFIIGGRGIGKTYSTLRFWQESGEKWIYLRRTQEEIDICATDACNPFKAVNADHGRSWSFNKKGKLFYVYNDDEEPQGYGCALSTFSNLRGADFSDVSYVLFDEFITEISKRNSIQNEADAFFNLCETINRNREILGMEPVKFIMLSNAVSLYSPILAELNLVRIVERMLVSGQENFVDRARSLVIQLPMDVEISKEKKETSLYKLTSGTRFHEHAITNKFSYDSLFNVKEQKLNEYLPLCGIDNIYIYKHKNAMNYYVTTSRADCPYYDSKESQLTLFKRNFGIYLLDAAMNGNMFFNSYDTKKKFLKCVGLQ